MSYYRQSVLRAIEAIEQRLRQPISLDGIARRAGFSLWHFHRIFAQQAGESLGSYIRRRRLTVAAGDLMQTRRSVLDIALDYNFQSHEAFTRAFKTVLHATPSEFRRKRSLAWLQIGRELAPRPRPLLSSPGAMQAQLVKLPALHLCGLSARFIGPLSPEANNLTVIPRLYARLHALRPQLPAARDQYFFGACRYPDEKTRLHPDEEEYFVGINAASPTKASPGTEVWRIPSGTYALFTHRGPVGKFEETVHYAYATWLPRSRYAHTGGPNLERSDERFGDGGRNCEFDFLMPVKPRKRTAPIK